MPSLREQQPAAAFVRRTILRLVEATVQSRA